MESLNKVSGCHRVLCAALCVILLLASPASCANVVVEAFHDLPVQSGLFSFWGPSHVHADTPAGRLQLTPHLIPSITANLSRLLQAGTAAAHGQPGSLEEYGLAGCTAITAVHTLRSASTTTLVQDLYGEFIAFPRRKLITGSKIKKVLLTVPTRFQFVQVDARAIAACTGNPQLAAQSSVVRVKVVLRHDTSGEKTYSSQASFVIDACSLVRAAVAGKSGTFIEEKFTFDVTSILSTLTDTSTTKNVVFSFFSRPSPAMMANFQSIQVKLSPSITDKPWLLYVRGDDVTGSLACVSTATLSPAQSRWPSSSTTALSLSRRLFPNGIPGEGSTASSEGRTVPSACQAQCSRQPWRVDVQDLSWRVHPNIVLELPARSLDVGECRGACQNFPSSRQCTYLTVSGRTRLLNLMAKLPLPEPHTTLLAAASSTCVHDQSKLLDRWVLYALIPPGVSYRYEDAGVVRLSKLVVPFPGGCACQ